MVNAVKKANSAVMTLIKFMLILTGTTMTVLVIMNVILRYVFSSGLTWSEEAARFLFIWTTFLGAILGNDAGLHGEHMRMDFVAEKFHGIPRKIVEELAMIIVLVVLVSLFIGSVELVKGTWAMPTSALKLPKGGVYMCAPICFGYMTLQTLARMFNIARATDDELNHKEAE